MLEVPVRTGIQPRWSIWNRTLRLRAEQTTWRADREAYLELFDTPHPGIPRG